MWFQQCYNIDQLRLPKPLSIEMSTGNALDVTVCTKGRMEYAEKSEALKFMYLQSRGVGAYIIHDQLDKTLSLALVL
jgi:hypothetical protein